MPSSRDNTASVPPTSGPSAAPGTDGSVPWRAAAGAAAARIKAGGNPEVEIMVPLVGSVMELRLIRDEADSVLREVAARERVRLDIPIGTMIELPVAALAAGEGIPVESIQQALKSFRSVKRRLEIRAEINGITIIDDFAHHPTAIRETLRALRGAYPQSLLWAVLEPRSNTLRRNVFEQELIQSLSLADRILMAPVFKSNAIPDTERLQPEHVTAGPNVLGRPSQLIPDVPAIVEPLATNARPGDVIAILSNGGFGGIYELLPAALAGPGS